jgi:hypothetical protein
MPMPEAVQPSEDAEACLLINVFVRVGAKSLVHACFAFYFVMES